MICNSSIFDYCVEYATYATQCHPLSDWGFKPDCYQTCLDSYGCENTSPPPPPSSWLDYISSSSATLGVSSSVHSEAGIDWQNVKNGYNDFFPIYLTIFMAWALVKLFNMSK